MRKPKLYRKEAVLKYLLEKGTVGPNARGFVSLVHREESCYSRHGGSPKLDFNIETQRGKCWYCGKFCNLHHIVGDYETNIHTFDEAEAFCLARFGNPGEIPDELLSNPGLVFEAEEEPKDVYSLLVERFSAPQEKQRKIEIPEGFVPLFAEGTPSFVQRMAVDYAVNRRRVAPQRLREMGVGVGTLGVWHGRLVMPVLDINDNLVMVTSRNFTEVTLHHSKTHHLGDKNTLYGINRAKNYDHGVLVEGPFDVLCNTPNFVAAFGKTLRNPQLMELARWNPSTLTIILDSDAYPEAIKLAMSILNSGMVKSTLRVGRLEKGDPADCSGPVLQEAIEKAVTVASRLDVCALQLSL